MNTRVWVEGKYIKSKTIVFAIRHFENQVHIISKYIDISKYEYEKIV